MTDPVRSLTCGFTPLSMTATVTPAPWVSCQAAGTSIRFRTHCWLSRMVSAAATVPGSTASDTAQPTAARTAPARRTGIRRPGMLRVGPGGLRQGRPPAAQHPGVPGQCGRTGGAASVSATDWATLAARLVISA